MTRAPASAPGRRARIAIALALATTGLPALSVAAQLDYRGAVLQRRQAEATLASALRAPGDSAALAAGLGRLVRELQNLGYLEARARATWSSLGQGRGAGVEPRLQVDVREGERRRMVDLTIDTVERADSSHLAAALQLAPGGWASPGGTREAVERAVRELSEHGHPYAQLGVTGFEWDSAGARVRMSGVLGPQVSISRARVDGLGVTRESITQRAVGRLAGSTYDRKAAEAGRERLVQLGLFRSVTFEGIEGELDRRQAQLVYRVEEPRYNRFEGAVGVQGEAGTVGLARLDLENLAGTGRAAALRWEARGNGVQQFGARYAEPLVLGAPLRAEGILEQHVEDTLYTRTRWGGRLRFALSGQEQLEAGYEQERVVQSIGSVVEAALQTTVFSLERDSRDQRLAPRRGTRARLTAAQTFKRETLRPRAERKARASSAEMSLELHRPLRGPSSRSGLAFELAGASRFSSERVLPLFERYSVGGAASLRGHDEQAFRVDRYALSRLEWRLFLAGGRQRVALFWDHALMATRIERPEGGDRLDIDHRDGVGFGLRLEAAGGLIGVDYGLEPGRAPLEGKIHLQLVSSF